MADKQKINMLPISAQDKAALLILCTAQEVRNRSSAVIKEYGISLAQLAILDILDKLPAKKATVNNIRELMVEDSPNVSRALNKLVAKDLVTKERSTDDQRVVFIRINQAGSDLHRKCDQKIAGNMINLPENESCLLAELLMKT